MSENRRERIRDASHRGRVISRLKTLHLWRIRASIPGKKGRGRISAEFNRSSSSANNTLLPCDTLCPLGPRLNSLRLSHVESSPLTHSRSLHWLSRSPENGSFIPNRFRFRDTNLLFQFHLLTAVIHSLQI